jgi:hypothetical protein
MRGSVFLLWGLLGITGCAKAPDVAWCSAEPVSRDGRAASRVSAQSERLDWAKSCVDQFGRYAARNDLRVIVSYTPPIGAEVDDVRRVQSLRDVIDHAAVPQTLFELRLRPRDTVRGLTDSDGMVVVDLADCS